MNNSIHYFLPRIWEEITDNTEFYRWDFLKPLIGKKIFWASVDWHNSNQSLPPGYEFYLIKTEGPNTTWLEQQANRVDGKLVVMCLPNDYNYFTAHKNIIFLSCVEWHYQLDAMQSQYGSTVSKSIDKKISILTNRITYSKSVALSAVLNQIPRSDVFYSLYKWIEDKNVHNWQNTSNATINYFKDIFLENFTNWSQQQDQAFLHNEPQYNYHHIAYQQCALNITNESWNYSLQHDKILPGPFITEKTLKCLLGETAFLPNGQHNTYGTLEQFGFKFDYGLDLSFDQELGDLTRLEGLVDCINTIGNIDNQDLFERTRYSCLHNKDCIVSKEFYHRAEEFNVNSLNKLLSIVE